MLFLASYKLQKLYNELYKLLLKRSSAANLQIGGDVNKWKVSAVLPLMSNSLPNHSVRTRTIRCRPSCFYIFVLLCTFETLDLQTSLVRVTRPCRMILLSGSMASLGQVFLIERGEKVQLFVSWGRIIALVGLGLFDMVLPSNSQHHEK